MFCYFLCGWGYWEIMFCYVFAMFAMFCYGVAMVCNVLLRCCYDGDKLLLCCAMCYVVCGGV